jgi:hypothetical protein
VIVIVGRTIVHCLFVKRFRMFVKNGIFHFVLLSLNGISDLRKKGLASILHPLTANLYNGCHS